MTPYHADPWLTVYQGDCREVMRQMEPESVHCVVTSPPYWGLRTYDACGCVAQGRLEVYEDGRGDRHTAGGAVAYHRVGQGADPDCPRCHGTGRDEAVTASQLGLEATPEEFVANMVDVFREVRRVLRKDGTCWVNLGDSYVGAPVGSFNGGGFKDKSAETGGRDLSGHATSGTLDKTKATGLKPKDLVGIPWRVAFALQADGWYLRSDIIWAKPNPMPESVTDRPTKSHEYLFLLTKSARYAYDADAVREADSGLDSGNGFAGRQGGARQTAVDGGEGSTERWRASKKPDGWATHDGGHGSFHKDGREAGEPGLIRGGRNLRTVWTIATAPYPGAHFATFPPKLVEPCIKAGSPAGGVVLDPFAGSGTTGMVAQSLSRRAVLIDLNGDYLVQAMARNAQTPLNLEAS